MWMLEYEVYSLSLFYVRIIPLMPKPSNHCKKWMKLSKPINSIMTVSLGVRSNLFQCYILTDIMYCPS